MTKEVIFTTLKESFNEIIPEVSVDEITIEDSLRDLGANSIDRAEILIITMECLNISMPMVKFGNAKNIKEIVEIIDDEVSK